jgi:endonuclease/exonuclease/phosphatase (EEP) superfamily protein YafD
MHVYALPSTESFLSGILSLSVFLRLTKVTTELRKPPYQTRKLLCLWLSPAAVQQVLLLVPVHGTDVSAPGVL